MSLNCQLLSVTLYCTMAPLGCAGGSQDTPKQDSLRHIIVKFTGAEGRPSDVLKVTGCDRAPHWISGLPAVLADTYLPGIALWRLNFVLPQFRNLYAVPNHLKLLLACYFLLTSQHQAVFAANRLHDIPLLYHVEARAVAMTAKPQNL